MSREIQPKQVYVGLLHSIRLLLALASPPGARQVYPELFHKEANFVFQAFGGGRTVHLVRPNDEVDAADTKMTGYEQGRFEPSFSARFKIYERGYWPLVCVVAMVLATPLPLLQRLLALLAAVALSSALMLLQVGAVAFASFGLASGGADSELWSRVFGAAEGIFNSVIPRPAAVLLIWAAVARPSKTIDGSSARAWLARLLGQPGPDA